MLSGQLLSEVDQRVERRGRAAVVDRRLGGAHAGFQAVHGAGHVDRRARVEHRDVARRARLAGEDPAGRLGVHVRRAAGQRRGFGARQPHVLGGDVVCRVPARRRPRRRALSPTCSSRPDRRRWTLPAPSGRPAGPARPRSSPGSAGSETPITWRSAPAGLVSGPRKLKIVRTASSLRTGTTKRVAPWWAGANMNPNPTSLMQRATASGLRSMRTPSASSTSAEPDRPVALRLPCLATAQPVAGGDQRGGRGDVERRPPAAGAGGVDQVVAAGRDRRRERAHRRGEADQLVDRLALGAQRDQHAGGLHLGGVAGHDLGQHRGGLLGGQVVAGRERVERLGQDGVRQGSCAAVACRPA